MRIKSPYPNPPQPPEGNAYYILFGRQDLSGWPDFPAHIEARTGEQLMHRELISRIEALSTGLASPPSQGGLGLASTALIGIIGENSSVCASLTFIGVSSQIRSLSQEYITLFHACLRNATTSVQISPHSTTFELNHALSVSKPTCLFIDADLLDRMLPACTKAGIADDSIYILKARQDGKDMKGRRSCLSIIYDIKTKKTKTVPIRIAAKDSPAYLLFSSGTTGLPKGHSLS